MKYCLMVLMLISTVACLKTRSELAGTENNGMTEQPVNTTREPGRYVAGTLNQQQRAQIDSRFYEIDRDFRQLYGKIEVIEKQMNDGSIKASGEGAPDPEAQKKIKDLEARVATLEEAILAIDKKVSGKGKTSFNTTSQKPKGPFALGEKYFAEKDFENAVQSYEAYRRKWPKGKRYADSTFKMGECFRNLKMNRDARAFYQEVVDRFPKTAVAKAAQKRLKTIQ